MPLAPKGVHWATGDNESVSQTNKDPSRDDDKKAPESTGYHWTLEMGDAWPLGISKLAAWVVNSSEPITRDSGGSRWELAIGLCTDLLLLLLLWAADLFLWDNDMLLEWLE